MAVLPAVTAVLLHHCARDTGTYSNIVSTVLKETCGYTFSNYSNVHHIAMDTGTYCNVVSTG